MSTHRRIAPTVRLHPRLHVSAQKGENLATTTGDEALTCDFVGALGGIRTPNLLIRSQMLYPLSYERRDRRV